MLQWKYPINASHPNTVATTRENNKRMQLPSKIKSDFYEQVWAQVLQIPEGRVATYGQIAKLVPVPDSITVEDYQLYASRWVGLAMAASPDHVPWQRVINSQGKISPRAEAGKQKQLLESEGVFFSNDKISLNEFQWRGAGHSDEPTQSRLF